MRTNIEFWLFLVVALLVVIAVRVSDIAARLKERFPTEKEEDHKWSQVDPAGHYEAHRNDEK